MEQPRVSRSRVDEVREPKLLDAPEPLEGSRLNDAPKHTLEMYPVDIEFDQIVQWIANSLLPWHKAESPSSQQCCIIEQKGNTSIPRRIQLNRIKEPFQMPLAGKTTFEIATPSCRLRPCQPVVATPNYRRAVVPGVCWFFTVNLLDGDDAF
jgi:hypothetical protein